MTREIWLAVALAITMLYAFWTRRRNRALVRALLPTGERARTHERRADEFLSIIRGIETERDTWQRFYFESSRQSGVAQNWLLRDLSGAVQRANIYAAELRKHGVKVKDITVDPSLTEVLSEYGEHHPADGKNVERAAGVTEAEKRDQELKAGLPTP